MLDGSRPEDGWVIHLPSGRSYVMNTALDRGELKSTNDVVPYIELFMTTVGNTPNTLSSRMSVPARAHAEGNNATVHWVDNMTIGTDRVAYAIISFSNYRPLHVIGALVEGNLMIDPSILDNYFGWGAAADRVAFRSADEAAKAFGDWYYSASLFVRHEVGTEIYSIPLVCDGKEFFLNHAVWGSPHSMYISGNVPFGATLEATTHTHPNLIGFSDSDIRALSILSERHERSITGYVVNPDLSLQRFNATDGPAITIGTVGLRHLSTHERIALETLFRQSWEDHIGTYSSCHVYGCRNISWLTQFMPHR